jgi:hypothetical protein
MARTDEIRQLVEEFAEHLEAVLRRMALEQVASALGGDVPARGGARRGAGARAGRKAARKGGRGVGRRASRRAGKRSQEQVGAAAEKVLAFVKKNPGLRGEQISKAMRTDTNSIRLPMQKLIADKKIKTKGQRRGMTYTAA